MTKPAPKNSTRTIVALLISAAVWLATVERVMTRKEAVT